jgi:hypothetical protein
MPRRRTKLLLALALALTLCLVGLAALAQHFIIHSRVNRQVETLNTLLQHAGPGLEDVHVMRSTHPAAWLQGHVATESDRAHLLDTLRTQFDDQTAHRMLTPIRVTAPATTRATTSSHSD